MCRQPIIYCGGNNDGGPWVQATRPSVSALSWYCSRAGAISRRPAHSAGPAGPSWLALAGARCFKLVLATWRRTPRWSHTRSSRRQPGGVLGQQHLGFPACESRPLSSGHAGHSCLLSCRDQPAPSLWRPLFHTPGVSSSASACLNPPAPTPAPSGGHAKTQKAPPQALSAGTHRSFDSIGPLGLAR